MKRKLVFAFSLAALVATLTIGSSRAQNPSDEALDNANDNAVFLRCGTKEPEEKEKKLIENNSKRMRELRVAADSSAALERSAGSVTINVYVHVITNRKGTGNVSDAAIANQITVLNQAYSGTTGGTNTPFRFQLAGTDRTKNDKWYTAVLGTRNERDMKNALHRGTARRSELLHERHGSGTARLGHLPVGVRGRPTMDGVVCHFASLPGGTYAPYNLGDTATHEVGHWLGLYHTFQGGCTVTNDEVADTTAQASPTFGCPVGRDSCTDRRPRQAGPHRELHGLQQRLLHVPVHRGPVGARGRDARDLSVLDGGRPALHSADCRRALARGRPFF